MPADLWSVDVYATIDTGFGYNTNGANWNPSYANGVASAISKQGYGPKWQQVPNGINQSVLGLKLSQPIGWGWSIVGTVETAADPYSLWIANGQRSQVMNNGKGLLQQNYNSDFEPLRPMGQLARLRRPQQQDLWNAGLAGA